MLATRITELPTPPSENTSKPDASTVSLLPPAALTAGMVRRGHDPWWGEAQQPRLQPGHDDASARLARLRAQFEEKNAGMDGANAPDDDILDLDQAAALPTDDVAPSRIERRPSNFMRDVAIFLTVLMTSCVVTLYLSLRLD